MWNPFKKKQKLSIKDQILKFPIIVHARRVGNTTRIVDHCIQELFLTGQTKVWDHFYSKCDTERKRVFDIVRNRLCQEHRWSEFKYDTKSFTITLIK